MTITRIALIRHGETDWNKTGRWQGHAPIPLNEEGLLQARKMAAYIANRAMPISAIYSSDLSRCQVTAQALAAKIKLEVQLDVRLREINIGRWQGLTHDEIMAWDSNYYHQRERDQLNIPLPGGESSNDVAARAGYVVRSIVEKHPGQWVAVVTHGGVVRNLLRFLGILPFPPPPVENTSITLISHEEGRWILEYANRTEHLSADEHLDWSGEG
ncbi:MAG: histidine phosphatase family protein [Anaerolinea sp.]|nr:histidine phosphatase family protein [Anaerolinea sp.]MCC6974104.1 histidine phosphatase family protein [Anaerolineae bacterium]CAG1012944.1 putative phosphoglycerate mutase [Anaerolineae bacterium]